MSYLGFIETYHIHIAGIVQGVGFRPHVYQLAKKLKLAGWVYNSNDGVHIEISCAFQAAEKFYHSLLAAPPPLAKIIYSDLKKSETKEYKTFEIIDSEEHSKPDLPLTPDFAICEECREEIDNHQDRRYNYAFTTCTNCGPRFSIITAMPYDRPRTEMENFIQCPKCEQEYNNPLDRRYYSQTNSCDDCGIQLKIGNTQVDVLKISQLLKEGKIIAVKGIGGFMLIADASDEQVIKALRKRKNRPTKPFAVMYPHFEDIERDYFVPSEARKWFNNEVSPIILLEPKTKSLDIAKEVIAPGLNKIGCLIPYAPIFHLILREFGKPIIATSGNISGSPIIFQNSLAEQELACIADVIISHNRDIVLPQDDSVLSFSKKYAQKIILRRSRGLAPTLLNTHRQESATTILALGAHMKSSFAFNQGKYVYVSQYLGDMDSYLSQQSFKHSLNHMMKVLEVKPQLIISDQHPAYFTTEYARTLAEQYSIPHQQLQHHEAHFYAVLAENNLLTETEPVMGIIWDGTGYGSDAMIWGGETFIYKNDSMDRASHIPYFPFILGDKMPKEPRISALAVATLLENSIPGLESKFSAAEWQLYQPMLAAPTLRTSSMGRVFDAVACIVLDINSISYEGEAAMMLEAAASAYLEHNPEEALSSYSFDLSPAHPLISILNGVIADKLNNESTGEIAAKFHLSLVNLIRHEAESTGSNRLAFSGGVFQNSLLVDMILKYLQPDFELFFHRDLSPNDECISFGQLAYFSMHENNLKNEISV